MIRVSNFEGKAVYVKKEPKKKEDTGFVYKKLGKIHLTAFAPGGRRVAGFLIKRPDIALMVARPDTFVAYDGLAPYDKGYVIRGNEWTDDEAKRRLKLDWDRCILWNGMDAMTESGSKLGYVGDVQFDEKTGKVIAFEIGDGGAATKLVGSLVVPVEMAVGYERGFLKVRDEAANMELSGGWAAAAGEASAKAKVSMQKAGAAAKQNAHETGVMVDAAAQKGAFALGKAIGKARKAVGSDDEETEAAASRTSSSSSSGSGAKAKSSSGSSSARRGSSASSSKRKATSSASSSKQGGGQSAVRAVGRSFGSLGAAFREAKKEFDDASK